MDAFSHQVPIPSKEFLVGSIILPSMHKSCLSDPWGMHNYYNHMIYIDNNLN